MSVSVCSMKHFSSIENELHMRVHSNESKKLYTLHTFKILTNDQIEDLVDTWYSLNLESYHMRYRKDVTTDHQRERANFKHLMPIAFFKALKCLRYQIEKTTIEEFRNLTEREEIAFNVLNEIIQEVAEQIIKATEEYDKADWEID